MTNEDEIYNTLGILETKIRGVIIDICEIMHKAGYDSVPVGPLLNMLGVPPDRTSLHEDEYFDISGDDFLEELEEWKMIKQLAQSDPPDGMIH